MPSTNNTSQVAGYEGPTGREKKVHKTHFGVSRKRRVHPKNDPNWVMVGEGRWKYIPKETRKTGRKGAED